MDEECEESNGIEERTIEDAFGEEPSEKKEVEVLEKLVFPCEDSVAEEDAGDSEKPTAELTGTVDSLSGTNKVESTTETNRTDPVYENGKRKIKEEKPSTKVVVRRLPPFMTKETFLEQVSPIPQCDYMYFVNGDPSYGIYSYSRAYLNFVNQEDVFTFTRTFDNYVFLDSKGQEYPAIVEFSPFQRVPKQRSKKKDTLTGTIESDPMYISFKENLLAEALENSKPGAKTMKQHYFETEISTTEEISTTPLLEFLKQRRAEKARIRDERREEKKRKEAERKLKQKAKDKKIDGEEEETTKEVKVLQTKDRRGGNDKDMKCSKKKEEKEKLLKENRTREFKNRSGKSYQEERIRQAERREERKKESSGVTYERKTESQCSDNKETESTEMTENVIHEEKTRTPFIEKKRIYENKKKSESDDWKVEGDGDKRAKTDRNRGERRQRERERKRREEFASRKGFDKKSADFIDKKKSKSYKSVTNEPLKDAKDNIKESTKNTKTDNTVLETQNKQELRDRNVEDCENKTSNVELNNTKDNETSSQRRKSLESCEILSEKRDGCTSSANSKRRNSLESGNAFKFPFKSSNNTDERNKMKIKVFETVNKNGKKEISKEANNNNTKTSKHFSSSKEEQNKPLDNNELEHSKQETKNCNENSKFSDAKSRRAEALNSEGNNNSRSKDPRTDRRIRNKDRPSLQIYRPGMGKFSKQRLEKEKVLGSSTEVDSPSHSPSPTPKVKFPS